jgi:hypothetical protein
MGTLKFKYLLSPAYGINIDGKFGDKCIAWVEKVSCEPLRFYTISNQWRLHIHVVAKSADIGLK